MFGCHHKNWFKIQVIFTSNIFRVFVYQSKACTNSSPSAFSNDWTFMKEKHMMKYFAVKYWYLYILYHE